MTKITIGVPVLNQEIQTKKFLKLLQEHTHKIDEIIIIDNGSDKEFTSSLHSFNLDSDIINKIKVIRNDNNIGVRPALNQIWEESKGDIILFTHNDVEIYTNGWDDMIRDTFNEQTDAGIVGAYGAKGIGTADIYKKPYEMCQLARTLNVSDARMDREVHGFRHLNNKFENVAVFDGYFMAIKKELLDKVGGFSDILPQHHNYDNLICIQSIENGYENIVIRLDTYHVGGQTDVGEDWTKGFKREKSEIHADAHPPLYEYGKGILPIWIQDIYDESDTILGYELWINNKHIKTKMYD